MKLTCIVQIYNELKKDNLQRFMESVDLYCDALIVYNDGCTDGSMEWIADNYPGTNQLKTIDFIHGESNDFTNEIEHKQQMLQRALLIKSDWIFWLDCDEVIEVCGENGGIRALCNNQDGIDAYGFKERNLWRSPYFYRLDNSYNDGEFSRLWRNTGKLYYDCKPGLHQRQYPQGVHDIVTSNIKVIHYGFSSDDRIVDKYVTYKAHGQVGWALNRLVDERTLTVAVSHPEWFRVPPKQEEFSEVFKTPIAQRVV